MNRAHTFYRSAAADGGLTADFGHKTGAEFFPPHGRLLADTRDCLWVEDFRPPGVEVRSWTIFDSEGALTGQIVLPSGF